MSNNKKPLNDGYQPKIDKRGYQPQITPTQKPEPHTGYTPNQTGTNPTNPPKPPESE